MQNSISKYLIRKENFPYFQLFLYAFRACRKLGRFPQEWLQVPLSFSSLDSTEPWHSPSLQHLYLLYKLALDASSSSLTLVYKVDFTSLFCSIWTSEFLSASVSSFYGTVIVSLFRGWLWSNKSVVNTPL